MNQPEDKDQGIINLLLQNLSNAKQNNKRVVLERTRHPIGHHAMFTKVKSKGTPKKVLKLAKRSRRINRQRTRQGK